MVLKSESSLSVLDDGQKLSDNHKSQLVAFVPQTAVAILEKMLRQDKPSLNDEALHQEGMRLYHLIEPALDFREYQGVVGMSPEIAEGLVFRALHKHGICLGIQSEFHKWFLAYSMDSQQLNESKHKWWWPVRRFRQHL